MLGLVLLAAGQEAPPRSALSLLGRLQHERGGSDQHAQRYRSRRLDEGITFLTAANTAPLRFHLDFSSLYESSAPLYSACFEVGAWFRRGLPAEQQPPADGVETCERGGSEWSGSSDCWGLCTEADLVTPSGRQMIEDVVRQVAAEVSALLSVRPVEGTLLFETGYGRYHQALADQGYTVTQACAADCQALSDVAVDSVTYCEQGVSADAVISVTKPPVLAGVAGTGTHCASDQRGRPVWLVFAWLESLEDMPDSAEALSQYRGLVTHELLHALGFSNSMFINARDSSGARKSLLSLLSVSDVDGQQDEVWHFTAGRAYTLAQKYFNCYDESRWQGLPLMGKPELGRGSHWETRIMRDDVMSYGFRSGVSTLTLAAMEDLGFYLGNFSAADCTLWGYQQGCEYVTRRCGVAYDDRSANTSSSELCRGDPWWPAHPLALLEEECALGSNPCDSLDEAGYAVQSTTKVCNAQCYTGKTAECVTLGTGVEDAGAASVWDLQGDWKEWLFLGIYALAALAALGFVRVLMCPPGGSKPIIRTLAVIIGLAGSTTVFVAMYALYLDEQVVEEFVGTTTIYSVICTGALLAIVSLLVIVGMIRRSTILLLVVFLVLSLIFLLEATASFLVVFWIVQLNSVANDSIETLDGSGRWDGYVGEEVLAEVEGFVCRTYQLCCRDPALDLIDVDYASGWFEPGSGRSQATCFTPPEGTTNDISASLNDPSSLNFCRYVSGSSSTVEPANGVCDVLDLWVTDVDACQEHFCTWGVDGYLEFVSTTTTFLRSNAIAIGGACSALALLQLILIVNVWRMRSQFKKEHRKRPQQPVVAESDYKRGDRRSGTNTTNKDALARARAAQVMRSNQSGAGHHMLADRQQRPPALRTRVHHSLVRPFSLSGRNSDLKLSDLSESSPLHAES